MENNPLLLSNSSSSFRSPKRKNNYEIGEIPAKKLNLISFSILTFYAVNGGPYGIEQIVQAGGPFYSLIGFLLLFVWAVPEALITAEMSTAFPEASGSVAWVETAFGPFWGFQKGWLSWLSGVAGSHCYDLYMSTSHTPLLTIIN
jgi:amino acid transporter